MNRTIRNAAAIFVAALSLAGAAHAGDDGADDDANAVVAIRADGTLHVDGVIGPRFEADIRRALRRHRDVHRLVIDSPGGMRAQAFRAARLLNARRIPVTVERRCASACALLWALADSRELAAQGRLGLHRSSLDTGLPLPPAIRAQVIERNDRETDRVLRRAGFPERIVRLGADTPPTAMSWFGAGELRREGVPFVWLPPEPPATPATAAASGAAEAPLGFAGERPRATR